MRYKIGNILRGEYLFEAESDPEAWEKGRHIFQSHFPGTRLVYMFADRVVGTPRISKAALDSFHKPHDHWAYSWVTVCTAYSTETWEEITIHPEEST